MYLQESNTPAASFATAAFAAGNVASPSLSINSNSSSDSDDSKMSGGDGAAVGHKSTDLTHSIDSPPASPAFNARNGDDVDAYMSTDSESSKYSFLDHLEHYMEQELIRVKIIARLWSL